MVRLTNPKGQVKEMSDEEYTHLLWEFIESKPFIQWSMENNLPGSYTHGGKRILNRMVVQTFFNRMGYKVEKNIDLKKNK